MKFYINIFLAMTFAFNVFAQEKPVKIIFDVTSSDVKVHQSAIRHIKAMSKAYPESQFEMVMYGGAMDMVIKGKSAVEDDIFTLSSDENISFVICQGTMKRHKVEKSVLIPGVIPLPDGILELAQKQQEGWSYIKEGK